MLHEGQTVVERFVVRERAAAGGMGTVWRARDLHDGHCVALKLMHVHADRVRFEREAQVLDRLRNPAIVRYVSHGVLDDDQPFLVMEWLEGHDLAWWIDVHGQLAVADALSLCARVARGLAVAHEHDVIHRDLKPSNIFLRGDRLADAVILDFGIARVTQAGRPQTKTGAIVGTLGYLAPEQARSARDVDARADLFSLGCVLFECLTGRPAFMAETVMGLLAKLLLEEAPLPSDIRPEVPEAIDSVVADLLTKDRAKRLGSAGRVARLLESLARDASEAAPPRLRAQRPSERPRSGLGSHEMRLVGVICAIHGERGVEWDATLTPHDAETALAGLRESLSLAGARVDALADGSYVATLLGGGNATDLAATAGRCAMLLAAALPDHRIALAIGRALVAAAAPVGEAIDRAAALARAHTRSGSAAVDPVASSLLGRTFEIELTQTGSFLIGERPHASGHARLLLGRPSLFVGRTRELAILENTWTACLDEGTAQAVLVLGETGVGKSRLRDELLARVGDDVEVWRSRGDPLSDASPFGLIAMAVRGVCGIRDGSSMEEQRRRLREEVARSVEAEVDRVTTYLAELLGLTELHDTSAHLAAARLQPQVMGDQIRRAFEDFLAGRCRLRPILWVLDDLHWGDVPSVRLVDGALRFAVDEPLMVLGLGRPETRDRFPDLWNDRSLLELHLRGIAEQSAFRLARAALGDGHSDDAIRALVRRAGGIPLLLEELVRAAAEGRTDSLPGSVLAIVQSRLETLPPLHRRVLRAASVVGERFWEESLRALLDDDVSTSEIREALDELVLRELVVRSEESQLEGCRQLELRHDMVREAAYAMLRPEDRREGHGLAARWLESRGETDAWMLARHFERSASPARAAPYYLRAAMDALEGVDHVAAIERARRGRELAGGADEMPFLVIEGEALLWRGEPDAAREILQRARRQALPRSGAHYRASGLLGSAYGTLGDLDGLAALGEELLQPGTPSDSLAEWGFAVFQVCQYLMHSGRLELGRRGVPALRAMLEQHPMPALRCHLYGLDAIEGMLDADPVRCLEGYRAGARGHYEVGDIRRAAIDRANVGHALNELGRFEESAEILRKAVEQAERMDLARLVGACRLNLGIALVGMGRLDEARQVATAALAVLVATKEPRLCGAVRAALAQICLAHGEREVAEELATAAIHDLSVAPPLQPYAHAILAEVLLDTNRADAARASSSEAYAALRQHAVEHGEALIRLVHARAEYASGDHEGARRVLAEAVARLRERADRIRDTELQRSFLGSVPENRATLALAKDWGVSV